jgi:hypothetical protein
MNTKNLNCDQIHALYRVWNKRHVLAQFGRISPAVKTRSLSINAFIGMASQVDNLITYMGVNYELRFMPPLTWQSLQTARYLQCSFRSCPELEINCCLVRGIFNTRTE